LPSSISALVKRLKLRMMSLVSTSQAA
jgi:hypothetical protein